MTDTKERIAVLLEEIEMHEQCERDLKARIQQLEAALEPALMTITELDAEYQGRFVMANDEIVKVPFTAGELRDLRRLVRGGG